MEHIWSSLQKPILLLAPMEGVTDTVFRRIVAGCAKPDLFMTEFTSADGYFSKGRETVAEHFRFTKEEEPIIAQIWGNNPENMYRMAVELSTMGFSGIDINMGCPDRNVVTHGCGAALINNPKLSKELIEAVKKGTNGLPVSVKTRLGFKTLETERWISFLLDCGIDALIVHGRTARELSKVPAHWDEIGKVVAIRDRMRVSTKIIGNGDVKDANEALEKFKQYGVDGVMIGRGIFENLWAFDRSEHPHIASTQELFVIMKRHIELFKQEWGDNKHDATLKKFFKIYIKGFEGASLIRDGVMQTASAQDAITLLQELTAHWSGTI